VRKKGVIYTCITGEYDELISHKYVDTDYDYICFTDDVAGNEKSDSIWELRELCFCELDDVRNQRWHKLHPHMMLSGYEKSIYVDANINIVNSKMFDDIGVAIQANRKMSMLVHPDRDCLYDELNACLELGKDKEDVMRMQVDLIRSNFFPKNHGLFDTSVIYRCHNDRYIIKIMDDWWVWIEKYSRRDQLSLTYVLWRNQYNMMPLSDHTYRRDPGVVYNFGTKHVTKEELILQKDILAQAIIERLSQEIKKITDSSFWKITKPIRKIINSIKKRLSEKM